MKEAVIVIVLLGFFVLGSFLMGRVDRFLEENRKSIAKEQEKQEPACVCLSDNLTEEEMLEEIRRFRKTHKETVVLLCDSREPQRKR